MFERWSFCIGQSAFQACLLVSALVTVLAVSSEYLFCLTCWWCWNKSLNVHQTLKTRNIFLQVDFNLNLRQAIKFEKKNPKAKQKKNIHYVINTFLGLWAEILIRLSIFYNGFDPELDPQASHNSFRIIFQQNNCCYL